MLSLYNYLALACRGLPSMLDDPSGAHGYGGQLTERNMLRKRREEEQKQTGMLLYIII